MLDETTVATLKRLASDHNADPDDNELFARRIADAIMKPSCVGHYTCVVRSVIAGLRIGRGDVDVSEVSR